MFSTREAYAVVRASTPFNPHVSAEHTPREQVVSGSDVVVLAVKPDVITAVLTEIEQFLTDDSLVVSIAAGVPLSALENVSRAARSPGAVADGNVPTSPYAFQAFAKPVNRKHPPSPKDADRSEW